jgi:hypothetical protein
VTPSSSTSTSTSDRRAGDRWTPIVALAAVLGTVAAAAGGCAKSPTAIDITVSADPTVPAVAILQVTMVQPANPAGATMGLFRSLLPDTDASAEPFQFPAHVTFGAPAAENGEADLTVEAIDYLGTQQVFASGTAATTIRRESTVGASVLLHPVAVAPPTGSDAGARDSGPDAP